MLNKTICPFPVTTVAFAVSFYVKLVLLQGVTLTALATKVFHYLLSSKIPKEIKVVQCFPPSSIHLPQEMDTYYNDS